MTNAERNRNYRARKGKEWISRYYKEYRLKNHAGFLAYCKSLREKNKDKDRAYRIRTRDRKAEYDRQRYLENSDSIKLRIKKWAKSHPNEIEIYRHRRRALTYQAAVNLAGIKAFVKSVRSQRWIRCYYCRKKITTKGCHFDHIIPLIKGGQHSVENLCVACPPCNSSKQAKLVNEWKRNKQLILL